MNDLSLHLLDVALNSVRANATTIEIVWDETPESLRLSITDNGCGMDAEQLRRATDPFFSTRTTRKIGLGLPLLKQSAEQTGGTLHIDSEPGKGTRLEINFNTKHIDMPPVGNLALTLTTLFTGHQDINFVFRYQRPAYSFDLSTADLREALGDLPLGHVQVFGPIRDIIAAGIKGN